MCCGDELLQQFSFGFYFKIIIKKKKNLRTLSDYMRFDLITEEVEGIGQGVKWKEKKRSFDLMDKEVEVWTGGGQEI